MNHSSYPSPSAVSDPAGDRALVLLAAGRSRRMGRRDKLLLPLGHITVLAQTCARLSSLQATRRLAVISSEAAARVVACAGFAVCWNRDGQGGRHGSLRLALAALRDAPFTGGLWIALGDLPRLRAESGQLLTAGASRLPGEILIPHCTGAGDGHPRLFRGAALAALRRAAVPDPRGLIASGAFAVNRLPITDPGICQDIDTPADYRAALCAS